MSFNHALLYLENSRIRPSRDESQGRLPYTILSRPDSYIDRGIIKFLL
jgi:hypothetical protein